jgi:hypothetical protein
MQVHWIKKMAFLNSAWLKEDLVYLKTSDEILIESKYLHPTRFKKLEPIS